MTGELKVNFIIDNLRQVKKSLENVRVGQGTGTGAGANRGQGGGGKGAAFAAGGIVGLLAGMLSQLESITALVKVAAALLNALVAPLVPLLIGLFKPVFIGLNALLAPITKFLINNMDLVTAISSLLAPFSLITGGMEKFEENLNKVAESFGFKTDFNFNESLKQLGDILSNTWQSMKTTFMNNLRFIGGIFSGVWRYMKTTFMNNIEFVKGIFTNIWQSLKSVFFGLWEGLVAVFLPILTAVSNIFSKLVQGFIDIFNPILKFFSDAFNSFASAFVSGLNSIIRLINRVPGVNLRTISDRGLNTNNININIEGSADQNTVTAVVDRLRAELSRRGTF